jgi:predicted PolB exonuclease-like 3'-5' exonuclease
MNQPSNEIKYLLFDVESVPDGESIAATRYPGANLSSKEAIRKFRFELLAESGRDFVPYTYHVPVAVVIAKIREDYSLVEIVSLDEPNHRPAIITKHFWVGWERYNRPTLVTFNGRSFDIPLMELSAFRSTNRTSNFAIVTTSILILICMKYLRISEAVGSEAA